MWGIRLYILIVMLRTFQFCMTRYITRFNWQLLPLKSWCLSTRWSIKYMVNSPTLVAKCLQRRMYLKTFLFSQFFPCKTAAKFNFGEIFKSHEWFTSCFADHPSSVFILPVLTNTEQDFTTLLCFCYIKVWFSFLSFELHSISHGPEGEFI